MPTRSCPLTQGQHPGPAGQPAVLARLQALFPPAPNIPEKSLPSLSPPKSASTTRKVLRGLKIRILTWNMHDSVPKGDLEELLGKVPLWSSSNSTTSASIPNFPLDAAHPYHLVVVAGQECPSSSGIPMGLGASLNKLIEKDKDKDRESRDLEKLRSRHKDKDEDQAHELPSGWTSMIEDWLCQGSGTRTSSPTVADIGFPRPLAPRPMLKEPKKGPYQLLVKERMMGIYLALFIHRDLRPFIRGTSRSVVAAGLIGGRVGNKGGVGITINLDGTTLLFLNAHLAAHEGKLKHRLSNLVKIKTELAVDDFLKNGDPRVMAEDITDKFDYTFLCGDLNFRLDISRLHADWLVSRKEYAQALAFDQLTNLMKDNKVFNGFKEAVINFPPTFKYDVLRTLKNSKRQKSPLGRWQRPDEGSRSLSEADKKEIEELEKKEEEDEVEAEGEEATSMASSFCTSTHSRATYCDPEEDEDLCMSPSSQTMTSFTSKTSVAAAAHKVKTRWLPFLSSLKQKSQQARSHDNVGSKAHSSIDMTSNGSVLPVAALDPIDPIEETHLRPPQLILVNSSLPSGEEDNHHDKGVYDSSHKKRVPSWCDRILWKSTVMPEPEPGQGDNHESFWRPRIRVGQFFVNAFRPLSARVRKDSIASTGTCGTSNSANELRLQELQPPFSSPEAHIIPDEAAPFSRTPLNDQSRPTSPTRHQTYPELRRTSSATASPSDANNHHDQARRRMTASGEMPRSLTLQQYPHLDTQPSASSSRWRFLPSLFSHNTQSSTSIERPSSADTVVAPRKGDIVCLSYDTLDDRGMRRLQGRSDHRPVIGSYVVYV